MESPLKAAGHQGAAVALQAALERSIAAHQRLLSTGPETLEKIALTLVRTLESGHKIILFGNGGSAADAQHVAAELVGRFQKERKALAAIALTANTSILTAVANDYLFDQIFARQVLALAMPDDVVVGISTSGRSSNVLRGVKAGKSRGALTIGFTGGEGSQLSKAVDICFCAPASSTARIQELHLAAWHAICEFIDLAVTVDHGG